MIACGPAFFAAPFSGVLDPYTSGLWFAGGIKRMLTSWTGNLLRVRRSSDNTEQDIGYLSDGTLDITSLATFVGSNSAFIVKVYDQSGGGNDFGQATSGNQPRIVNAGTYDGFMRWDGTDDSLASVNTSPTVAAMSAAGRYTQRSLVANPNSQSVFTQGNLGSASHNSWGYQYQGNTTHMMGYNFTGTNETRNSYNNAVTTEVADLLAFDRAASGTARVAQYRNGAGPTSPVASASGTTTGNFTAETIFIGSYAASAQPNPMNGKWFAIWSNSQASNGVAISAAL